jgi:signal transduction histidine kinase
MNCDQIRRLITNDQVDIRSEADESLHAERRTTDELLEGEQGRARIDQVVRERHDQTEQRLQGVREAVDARLEQRIAILPEVSEKLEQVADSLTKAAESLTGVAGALKEATTATNASGSAAARPELGVVVSNLAEVAEQLKDTADQIADAPPEPPTVAEASGRMAEQLAEIAEGMAAVTATLAEERRDVDETLRKERRVTDQIIVQELEQVETALAEDLEADREVLAEVRQTTNEDLAEERRQTDHAVQHVLALLGEEQHAHAVAARNYATRNEFLGIVSHDLRGPLMMTSGVAALIEQQAPADATGDRIREWADSIKRSVGVMDRLIHDLLDLGSFEDGQLRVSADRQDIREPIQSAVDALHALAAAASLSLEASLPDEPLMATFDHHRILQVLSNLIDNAIKFTPRGGSIRVRVVRKGNACEIAVADTGVGIPQHELKSIFQRFRQLAVGDRTGLGLGLYISMWIIEAHGGRIWAESTVGTGTTFYFTLPD